MGNQGSQVQAPPPGTLALWANGEGGGSKLCAISHSSSMQYGALPRYQCIDPHPRLASYPAACQWEVATPANHGCSVRDRREAPSDHQVQPLQWCAGRRAAANVARPDAELVPAHAPPPSPPTEAARWAMDRCGVAYAEEAYLPMLHMPGVWWSTLGWTGRQASNVSSSFSTPLLMLPGESPQLLHSSIGIVQYADEHRSEGAPSLMAGAPTPGVPSQQEAALFTWLREHLSPAPPTQQPVPDAPLPEHKHPGLAGLATCDAWDAATLPDVPEAVLAALPPPAQRALAHPCATPPTRLPLETEPANLEGLDALALMQHMHDRVGPLSRRAGYHEVFRQPGLFGKLAAANVAGLQAWIAASPAQSLIIQGVRSLNINAASATKARKHLLAEFEAVGRRLEAGGPFLCPGGFGAADLYWAAMVAPALMVQPGEGMGAVYPWDDLAEEFKEYALTLRGSLAGRHALACFALYRHAYLQVPAAAATGGEGGKSDAKL